jgi:hypothetical protein
MSSSGALTETAPVWVCSRDRFTPADKDELLMLRRSCARAASAALDSVEAAGGAWAADSGADSGNGAIGTCGGRTTAGY